MMTERQAKILAAVIEQYAELANPVGSVILAKLFNISPATVRMEMARLEDMGYLEQPHTSSGRIPTDKGYRVYVNSISENYDKIHEKNLRENENYLPDFSRKTKALFLRISTPDRADVAIKNAVDSLVDLTRDFGFATIGEQLYLAGLGNLFSQPEFLGGTEARDVARLIDQLEPWLREAEPNQPLNVFIGAENPIGKETGVSLIISRFRSPFSDKSYIGVLGSTRQNYAKVMSLVAETGRILERNL